MFRLEIFDSNTPDPAALESRSEFAETRLVSIGASFTASGSGEA
jgi:hypothetical protein